MSDSPSNAKRTWLVAIFLFGVIATIDAAKKDAPEPESSSMIDLVVDTVKGVLLGTLSFGTFPIVGSVTAKTLQIMGRACFAANKLGKAKLGPKTTYAFITFVMTAFGGGVLCPLLLGSSPKPLQSDTIIVVAAIAYLLFTQTDFKKAYNTLPVTIFGLILENAFKGGLIVAFFGAAKETLGTKIGPLLVGTVAGCGGALLGGLSPIKASVPKGVWSSAAACAFVALATDASYTEGLPIDLPSLSKDDATLIVVVALAADAIYGALPKPSTKAKKN
jgi:hypothetical protein